MEMQRIEINGKSIIFPGYYQRVDSMPDDPEGSIPFMVQTENAICFFLVYAIPPQQSIPDQKEALIAGIRSFMGDNQGLIQVEANNQYAYSIVKTLKKPSGVQYVLTFQQFYPEFTINIQGFFEEAGTTGIRDMMVYELCCRQNLVGSKDDPFEGWICDPYDSNIKSGTLMNLSEQEQYDDKFPGFPLSMCREFVKNLEVK